MQDLPVLLAIVVCTARNLRVVSSAIGLVGLCGAGEFAGVRCGSSAVFQQPNPLTNA